MTIPRVLSCTLLLLVAICLTVPGCSSPATSAKPASAVRSYNGTASVGDFLTISIDSDAHTITYNNLTNGESGTVPYTTNSDGSYTITDPQGNLLAAYEVPGSILLVESSKSGPSENTPALITAIETVPATISSFAGKNYNYMQFRTAAGGIEVGTVSIDAQGDIQHDAYSPMALVWGNNQYFNGGTFAASSITEDSSGDFFTINEADSSKDVVFGTQNGLWAVDGGNGAILGLPKAASKAFDPANAGTYSGIFYQKANAQTGQNNVETGTPSQGKATITVSSAGSITITDSQSNVLATGQLVAFADSSYIYDGTSNTLSDSCYGMFTLRLATSNSRQDLFVAFQGNAVIFGSFQSAVPGLPGNTYNYFYGVGAK